MVYPASAISGRGERFPRFMALAYCWQQPLQRFVWALLHARNNLIRRRL
jgi:hypothetical protein